MQARSGMFAGCISATANLNADLCARAWRSGDAGALDAAVAIRKLFDGKPLVPGVKALLAHIHRDAAWVRVKPPLTAFSAAEQAAVATSYDGLRTPASARSKMAARPPKGGKERPWGNPGLPAGGANPPLARKAAISRNQLIVCRVIPIDRAASTSRLTAVDAPWRGDYKRLLGGEALAAARFLRYRAARRRAGQPAPKYEHSHAQPSFLPPRRPPHRA